MTPDELCTYLHKCFPGTPDVVQDVMIAALQRWDAIRAPKSWAFKRVMWRRADAARKVLGHNKALAMLALDITQHPPSDNPLKRAEQRERLRRFEALHLTPFRWGNRWKNLREDYQVLFNPESTKSLSRTSKLPK